MPIRNSLLTVVLSAGLLVSPLGACSREHKPVDTAKVFEVKSSFGDDYKIKTKGPTEIDPKMLGPQKLPPAITFDPADCGEYVASGRLPKGIRGKMSVFSASGEGNQFAAIAVQADQDVPFDSEEADKCQHVTFGAGKIAGTVDEVDVPDIKGAKTTGTRREIQITVNDGQHSREVYNFAAYFGDWLVFVTASPVVEKGQEPTPVNADRARQLLVDAAAAVRS